MKKSIMLLVLCFLALVLSFVFIGCGESSGDDDDTTLTPSTIIFEDGIEVSKTVDTGIIYTNTVSGDGDGAITYSSLIPGTATVNETTGEVTHISAGTTVITANKAATNTHAAVTNSYILTVIAFVVIGDYYYYQGGKVAYILQLGELGYDASLQHGLIAAIADQSTGTGIIWALVANQGTAVPDGTSAAFGTGSANTDNIIAQNGAGDTYAAGLARACEDGGYVDWYLPSMNELNKLFLNRLAIEGFTKPAYWSSFEYSATNAWQQSFSGGVQDDSTKGDGINIGVRAVRTF